MTYISAELRRLVIQRADHRCEYCLIHQEDSFFPFEIDHIISEKHDGETTTENLCLSCADCNAFKGSDIGSIDRTSHLLTALFDPRRQNWSDHFVLNGPLIEPVTPEGRVTARLLKLNSIDRVEQRKEMMALNRYPPELK